MIWLHTVGDDEFRGCGFQSDTSFGRSSTRIYTIQLTKNGI